MYLHIQSDLSYPHPIYPVSSPSIAANMKQIYVPVCTYRYLTYPVPSVNPEICMKQMCADKWGLTVYLYYICTYILCIRAVYKEYVNSVKMWLGLCIYFPSNFSIFTKFCSLFGSINWNRFKITFNCYLTSQGTNLAIAIVTGIL